MWGEQVCGSQCEYNRAIFVSGGARKSPSRARTAELKGGGLKAIWARNAPLRVSDNRAWIKATAESQG